MEEASPGAAEIRARVLIVDDEQGPRESLRMILSPSYEVLCARDGIEALEVLQTAPVDVVTLDLNMPGIKGDELMHRLRSRFPSVEVIVITGYATLRSATEGIRAGLADYLAKPFDVVQVTSAVARAAARGRGRRRLAGFLEALGEVVGRERDVGLVLAQLESSPRLRERAAELVESAGRNANGEAGALRPRAFLELLAEAIETRGSGGAVDPDLARQFLALVESGACVGADGVAEVLRVASAWMRSGGAGRAVDRSMGAAR